MTERLEGKGSYLEIPGTWIKDAYSPDGWRFIATTHGWKKLHKVMAEITGGYCEAEESQDAHSGGCSGHIAGFGDLHHRFGRGAGKRDDRIEVNGLRNLYYLSRACHNDSEIEKRVERFEELSQ